MANKVLMRVSKNPDAVCTVCGNGMNLSVDMFDIKLGNAMVHVCDKCMEQLATKCISAVSYSNGRTKQMNEIKKKNKRIRMAKG